MDLADPCPRCKSCTDCTTGFQKVVDLKNAGLAIYRRQTKNTETVKQDTDIVVGATKTTEDVFILQNMQNTDLTSKDFLLEMEKKEITCPRCRAIMKRALKLLQKVPAINKNETRGICNHCKLKRKPCKVCDDAVNKFFYSTIEDKKPTKQQVREWLGKVKKKLRDYFLDKSESGKKPRRALSEIRIDELCRQEPARGEPEPDIRNLFSKSRSSGLIIKTKKKHIASNLEHPSLEKPSGSKTNIVGDRFSLSDFDNDVEKLMSSSYAPRDYREARQMTKEEQEASETFLVQTASKEDIIIQRKKSFIQDFVDFKKSMQLVSQKGVRYDDDMFAAGSSKTKADEKEKDLKYYPKAITEQNIKAEVKDRKAVADQAPSILKRQIRKYQPKKTKMPQKSFSFTFPHEVEDRKKFKSHKSSSELIKDTQDMLQAREEEKMRKLEEERRRKAEEEEKKRIARKERARLAAEEKRLADEKKKEEQLMNERKELVKEETEEKRLSTTSFDHTTEAKTKESTPKLKPKQSKYPIDASKMKKLGKTAGQKSKSDINLKSKAKEININKIKSARPSQDDVNSTIIKQSKERLQEEIKETNMDEKEFKKESTHELKTKTVQTTTHELKTKKGQKSTSKINLESKKPKEIDIKKIKIAKPSQDNLILRLVQIKKLTKEKDKKKLRENKPPPGIKVSKKYEKPESLRGSACPFCLDSDSELHLECKKEKSDVFAEIIRGQKIYKYKKSVNDNIRDQQAGPLLFQSEFDEPIPEIKEDGILPPEMENTSLGEKVPPNGIIRFTLSDRTFIEKGWTILPTVKSMRKMNVYRMHPAHPEFDWFEHNKNKRLMLYDTGERLAEFDDNGRGRWYYRNGRLALDYYDAEESNAQQRFVIYSNGEPDEHGRSRPYTTLATFDYKGNGIVFDHSGKTRLKYNQTEGVVLDRNIGPASHWKWHKLNDPPVLQQVMIDTQMAQKDPNIFKMSAEYDKIPRPENQEMLAIEFNNYIKEKSRKITQSFKPFQIKMKALKINENFSLKVLDQATVYLIFRDGMTNLKLNIGMILDNKEIVDIDTAEVGEVSNNLERFPAYTDSLAQLQKSVAYAERLERTRTERERRLRPTQPSASVDKLTAAASRPMRHPLRTINSCSCTTATTADCHYK